MTEKAFPIDHDYHIHSSLSLCSNDPAQSPEAILAYGEANGFSELCLTDHFWDERVPGASKWYSTQNLAHIKAALPLPKSDKVRFYFGCETEMDCHYTIAVSEETMEEMDFIIIPTTHFHMEGYEDAATPARRAVLYVERLEHLLLAKLPYRKVGIAHLTCPLIANSPINPKPGPTDHLETIDCIPDGVFRDLFKRIAEVGMGIELNLPFFRYAGEDLERELRPYRIAKEAGCRFYFGSDAHHPAAFETSKAKFTAIANALSLTESDRFNPFLK